MKRIILIFLMICACSDSGLPRNPQISKLQAVSNGDSLTIYWNSIEGADYYRLYLDNKVIYEGKDTSFNIGYAKSFRVEALGLNDKLYTDYDLNSKIYSDSILIIPQIEALIFNYTGLGLSSITDNTKSQQFVIFFAQDSSKIGNSKFNKDSLKIFSASLYYNKLTRHKLSFYNGENVVPFPNEDSLKLIFKKDYILWYNPDTSGWDNINDYFIKFRVDSLTFSVDTLNDTTYRLKVYYEIRTVPGLRWF